MIATMATNKNSLKFKIIIKKKKQLMTIGHGVWWWEQRYTYTLDFFIV
jgi:hypothetical protein